MGCLSPNPFDLFLTVLTQKVEAHAIALRFLDIVIEAVAEQEILGTGEVTLKHTVLYPLAKILQRTVDTATAFIVFDIIGNDQVHNIHLVIKGGYSAISPLRRFANRRACNSKQR